MKISAIYFEISATELQISANVCRYL